MTSDTAKSAQDAASPPGNVLNVSRWTPNYSVDISIVARGADEDAAVELHRAVMDALHDFDDKIDNS